MEERKGEEGKEWGRERVGRGGVRDCAVLKISLKKPWSWTLANFETDRRRCRLVSF